jgi:hypothetical protein
MKSSLTRRSRI